MRSHKKQHFNREPLNHDTLQEAIDFLSSNNIPLWGVNINPEQEESQWTTSPKPFANLYIDDYSLGIPLLPYSPDSYHQFKIVDWSRTLLLLLTEGYLTLSEEQVLEIISQISTELSSLCPKGSFIDYPSLVANNLFLNSLSTIDKLPKDLIGKLSNI